MISSIMAAPSVALKAFDVCEKAADAFEGSPFFVKVDNYNRAATLVLKDYNVDGDKSELAMLGQLRLYSRGSTTHTFRSNMIAESAATFRFHVLTRQATHSLYIINQCSSSDEGLLIVSIDNGFRHETGFNQQLVVGNISNSFIVVAEAKKNEINIVIDDPYLDSNC
ncbi:MAG: hypothetical protein ABW087_20925 [Candidatus Thiodiazotropha sp.]